MYGNNKIDIFEDDISNTLVLDTYEIMNST